MVSADGPTLAAACRLLLEPRSTPSVEERVTACARLAGAVGRRAIEALVAGLDDRSSRVRAAAVAALSTSAARPGHGLRLVHAALHRRADVRALAIAAPSLPPALLVTLLGDHDGDVAGLARARATARVVDEPPMLVAVLQARRRGSLDDDTTIAVLLAAPWAQRAVTLLRGLPGATPAAAVDVAALEAAAAAASDDLAVDLIALAADHAALRRHLVQGLRRAARAGHLDSTDRDRLAVVVAVVAATRGAMPPTLLACGLLGGSALLRWEAIPLEVRRAGCAILPRMGVRGRSSTALADIVAASLLRRPDGRLDLDVAAGGLWLCAERPWAALKASFAADALATAFVLEPPATLLALPPEGVPDRFAWRAVVDAIASALDTLPDDAVLDAFAWQEALLQAPADIHTLVDALERRWPGATARLLTAVIDADLRGTAAPDSDEIVPDDADREQRRHRRARTIAACVTRCALSTRAGLVRQALHQPSSSTSCSSGSRDVVAAICAHTPLEDLASLIDGLPASQRPRILDLALDPDDGAPSPWRPAHLEAALRSSSPTMLALARRDAAPEPLDVAMLHAAPWGDVAALVLQRAALMRCAGFADVIVERVGAGDPPPRRPDLVAAVLISHDAPHRTARALAAVWPGTGGMVDTAVIIDVGHRLRARCPEALWPEATALLVAHATGDADVGRRLRRLIDATPGGLKGLIDLVLVTPGIWSTLWLASVVVGLQQARAHDGATSGALADGQLRRILDDVVAGDLLMPDDPRRADLLALARLVRPPPAKAPPGTTAAQPRRPALATIVAGGADAAAWLASATGDACIELLDEALVDGLVPIEALGPVVRTLPAPQRQSIATTALRSVVPLAELEAWLRLLSAAPFRGHHATTTSPTTTTERLAAIVAEGQREAMALCGGSWRISFIADGLGHTRLGSRRVCVNPLPLLTGERDGDTLVRGLILHELGHHRFHADVEARAVWAEARQAQLHALLNLVADEHLERRLRAMEPERWGAPLKTLAAWAFQHMHKELGVEVLLASLGPRAHAVLTGQRLGVARRPDAVVVDVGTALSTLARRGSSFSRFMRALRMGRHDGVADPKVQAALALFPAHRFRASSMRELLGIARRLREIFGDDTRVLDAFDFHRLTDASADDLAAGGVDPIAAERQAGERQPRQRLRGPRTPARRGHGATGGAVNVDDDTAFDPIDRVERAVVDAGAHAAVARLVQRPARVLRQHLLRIGTGLVVERRRLSGRRLDRSALVGAVLKGDPRLLTARRHAPAPDVFIGVAIDCSGSMDGDNLERARHFGVLLAEAVRGLPDIEARFIGFTDDTITDAGDARRCAVTSLEAGGGNNDAAALQHLARLARQSRRSTVLLVMISDGAPTECSVGALRSLVDHLMGRGMLCAQVAVEAIDDDNVCFAHHILLADDDLAGAARRFGAVIEGLLATARTHRTRRSHA